MSGGDHTHYLGAVVGANIRRERFICGLTQVQLAERLNSHRPVVSRVERGLHAPTLETIEIYAKALDCSYDALLIGVDKAVQLRW